MLYMLEHLQGMGPGETAPLNDLSRGYGSEAKIKWLIILKKIKVMNINDGLH